MKYLKKFESLNDDHFTEDNINDIKDAFMDIVDDWSLVKIDIKELRGPDGFPDNDISYEIKLHDFSQSILLIQVFIPKKYKFKVYQYKFGKDCDSFIERINQMGFKSDGFSKNKSFFYEFWTASVIKKI